MVLDYCKKQGIPPAQTWAWEQAEKAFCMTHNPKLTGERMNEVNEASPASITSDVERVVRREAWNKCDVCGKFISFNDFEAGAIRRVIDPVDEIYETLCIEHKDA